MVLSVIQFTRFPTFEASILIKPKNQKDLRTSLAAKNLQS